MADVGIGGLFSASDGVLSDGVLLAREAAHAFHRGFDSASVSSRLLCILMMVGRVCVCGGEVLEREGAHGAANQLVFREGHPPAADRVAGVG
jgi:hypothetical protein